MLFFATDPWEIAHFWSINPKIPGRTYSAVRLNMDPASNLHFALSSGLHISVLWDDERVVGDRNMRYGPHFLGEMPSYVQN